MANKDQRLTKDDLKVLIKSEISQAYGYGDGLLEQKRRKNQYYFYGEAKEDLAPPDIPGRSRVVDTTVRNTVLGMEAPLLKTFYGSDNVFEFEPEQPGDEPKAKLISEYVNYIFRKKNPGYEITSTWIREALLQKIGIIKVWWDDSDIESRETYLGQTDVQLAILMDDPEVEIIEQKSYPDEDAEKQKAKIIEQAQAQLTQMGQAAQQSQDPQAIQQFQQATTQYQQMVAQPVPLLYDVVVRRTKTGGRVCIENVPPEEFLISKRAKSIKTSPYCGHRFKRTMAQLKSAGYDVPDDLGGGDTDNAEQSMERIERMQYDDEDAYGTMETSDSIDPSQREVWVVESYLQVDMDGDGIPEWRKVVTSGDYILSDEEFDEPPFVALGSIPLPHLFYGMCPADLALEPQRINTSLIRAQLDNVYLQVNGRYYAVEGQVNLDDLLTSRPGGVVRVKGPQSVGRLDQGIGDTASAMQLMQWFEDFTAESTGWSRQSQGGNGLQLQQTATAANIVTNRADSRVESISRYMAETGFTDLGNLILKLVMRYQKKAEMVKVGGEWVNVDPREWTNNFSLNINVGLGTGNKDQLVQHLALLSQKQIEGLPLGLSNPQTIYQANVKLANALGFKNGDEFFADPRQAPPQEPQPNPDVVKAQLADQQHQREMQYKMQAAELDRQNALQIAGINAEAQMRVDQNRQQLEAEQQAMRIQQQAQLDAQQAEYRHMEQMARLEMEQRKLELERYKAELSAMTDQNKAQLTAETQVVTAQIAQGQSQSDPTLQAAEDQANRGAADGY